MKNLLYLKVGLSTLILFFSCNKEINNTREILDNAKHLPSIEIKTDFFLGRPYQITVSGDVLVIADNIEEKALVLYDSKEKAFRGRHLRVGQGPHEVLFPLLLARSSESNALSIMQRQNGLYSEYLIANLLNGDSVPSRFISLENADRFARTAEGFIISGPYEEGAIKMLDSVGNLVKNQNIYPPYINDLKQIDDRYIYGQGHIAYNKEKNVFVFASPLSGEVSFYELREDSLEKLQDFDFSLSPAFRNRIMSSTESASLKKTDLEYFSDIYTTKDHFYLLYTGETMENKNTVSHSFIFKFSAAGKLIDTYKTDEKIISFCVQKDDKKAYAIALSQDMDYILLEMEMF